MGYSHYIFAYVRHPEDSNYYYAEKYGGQSWFKALMAFRKAKKISACVKWEWRG